MGMCVGVVARPVIQDPGDRFFEGVVAGADLLQRNWNAFSIIFHIPIKVQIDF
jgi:hypothetical protein